MKCRQYDVKVFEIKIENDKSFMDFMDNNYVLLKNHLISIKGEISEGVANYLENKALKYVNNMELPIKRGVQDVCIISHIQEQNREILKEQAEALKSKEEQESSKRVFEEPKIQIESEDKLESKTQESLESKEENQTTATTNQEELDESQNIESVELQEEIERVKEEHLSDASIEDEPKLSEETKRVQISEKDILEKSPHIEDFGYGASPLKVITKPLRSGQFVQHDGAVLVMDRLNSGAKVVALGSVIALGVVEGDISSTGECLIIPRVRKGNIFFHGYRIDLERLVYPLNKLIFVGDRIVVQAIKRS